MRKALGIGLVLVAALVFAPLQAAACKSCDVSGFWDPNCSHSGCTYCVACSVCCGGDPGAGGNCALYCGGAASSSTASQPFFLGAVATPSGASNLPAFMAPTQCPQ